MSFKTFYSLRSLLEYADAINDRYDTVSIDLFDTLLIRRIHDPDMVKPAVARFIAMEACAQGVGDWKWEEVQRIRDTVEAEQRADTATRFEDHEACYPVFMHRALSIIFKDKMTPELLDRVTDYELLIENAMLVPRAPWVAWLQKLKDLGKRVIIVSDIYLPSSHLKRLVKTAGLLTHVDDVVSSADTFLAKASGRAYELLREKYGLDCSRWLHIGDNPISDGLRPESMEIRALVLKDRQEKYRKTIAKLYAVFSRYRPYWHGRLLQQLMLPLEAENKPRHYLYVEGYNFFGFLMGFFMQGIIERVKDACIRKIFFFSREGWAFKNFWDQAVPYLLPGALAPKSQYLCVSRLALAGASCAYGGLPKEKADIAFLPPKNKDMRDFCRVFSLDITPITEFMRRYGITDTLPVSPVHSMEGYVRFTNLVRDEDFQYEVKRQSKSANDALQLYLESVGFFDEPDIALVDVGWMGTIQRFLYDAVAHREDKPRFHGLLFAASRGIPYPTREDDSIKGVLYDRGENDFAGSTMMYVRDLFEEACRAPHPSVIGYARTRKGFRILFRKEGDGYANAESRQDDYYFPLREGIFDAASRFGAAAAILGYRTVDLRPWLYHQLVSKIAFPKTLEVKAIKHQYHMDDFGGVHKAPKAVLKSQQKHLWDQPLWVLRWPFIRLRYYLHKQRPV